MSMLGPGLFYLASLLAVAGALGTVVARNSIRAVMCLLASIVGIAGLYLTLSAQLLAAIQLIVYAGAVVVLFVFVIMMLGPAGTPPSDTRTLRTRVVATAVFALGVVTAVVLLLRSASHAPELAPNPRAFAGAPPPVVFPHVFEPPRIEMGSVDGLGRALFTDGIVAFELTGVVLLVAIVGVMAVARSRRAAEKPSEGGTSGEPRANVDEPEAP